MSGNTFGRLLRLTTFGESHGPGIGGVLDGLPAGIPISVEQIQADLDRRKPGKGLASTQRNEADTVQLLSGVFEGISTGTPIGFYIANENQRPTDYSPLARAFRPGHADFSYQQKYGIRDYRGGGRASGRETAARVVGGAIARALLHTHDITITAATIELGGIPAPTLDLKNAVNRVLCAACDTVIPLWEAHICAVRTAGDTTGGIVQVEAHGLPAGLGEPVFDKLDAALAGALMSVGAVKGVEIGEGFAAARLTGSQNNDPMTPDGFLSNHAGGITGGISTGQPLVIRCAVKPIPSIALEQRTVDVDNAPLSIRIGGRHDICAIPRVIPVLEAMTALTLADALLLQRRMAENYRNAEDLAHA